MLHLPHNVYAFLENAADLMDRKLPGKVKLYFFDDNPKYKFSMNGDNYPIPPVAMRDETRFVEVDIDEEDIETWAETSTKTLILAVLLKQAATKMFSAQTKGKKIR